MSWSSIEAAIIYSGIQDEVLAHHSDASLNITMGGVDTSFRIDDERGSFGMTQESPIRFLSVFNEFPVAFDFGAAISSELDWSSVRPTFLAAYEDPDAGPGNFFDQTEKFIAIQVLDESDMFFGWVRASHSLEDEQFIVDDWAWNSVAGEPITTGQIPEPRTVALLAGLAALGGGILLRAAGTVDSKMTPTENLCPPNCPDSGDTFALDLVNYLLAGNPGLQVDLDNAPPRYCSPPIASDCFQDGIGHGFVSYDENNVIECSAVGGYHSGFPLAFEAVGEVESGVIIRKGRDLT